MTDIDIKEILSTYDKKNLTIATVCSHSSLQIFNGARKEGFKTLEEITSFTSTPEITIINPSKLPVSKQARKKIFQAIKKRLGKIAIREITTKNNGSFIIFDKVIFFPPGKQKAFLIS